MGSYLGTSASTSRLACLGLAFAAAFGSLAACGQSEVEQQRPPVLETVVSGDRVVPQDPDGLFAALPIPSGRVHLRIQADWSTNIGVSLDKSDLPRREGRSGNEA
jgi:hypothetical protein